MRHHVVALHLLHPVEGERRPDGLRGGGGGVGGRIGVAPRVAVAQRRPEVEEVVGVVLAEVEVVHRARSDGRLRTK